jgi:chorismate mutase/prephenate dehydratase
VKALSEKEIKGLRGKIDQIDNQILDLLNERAKLVLKVGELKQTGNYDFHLLDRECEIYERLVRRNPGPFPTEAIRDVFREILSASLSLEKTLKVMYLGPEATFCHIASIQQFGHSAKFFQAKGLADIFDEVERGRIDYGVVPIENSTEGVVNLTLDLFIDSPLKICAEVLLQVSHHLLSKSGKIEDIKRVYSHPQAIAQCSNWLFKNLPHIPIKEVFSTAKAAQHAAEDKNVAAIASEFAAKYYRLKVVRRSIEDIAQNFTKFWVIGKKSPGRTGSDKTSIMISLKDGVGALYHMLEPFADQGINLTKIESRPFKKRPWEYIFFIDIEGHIQDENVTTSLKEVKENSQFVKVLGSYPKSKLSEKTILQISPSEDSER